MRHYSNGGLDLELRYLRTEAEKAAQIHESNLILAPFYQRIVEMEVHNAEFHRSEQNASEADEW